MPGELVDIGRRPIQAASFAGAGADERFREWRARHEAALARVPVDALRVEYSRAGRQRWIRVRIEERHLPSDVAGPDEAGPAEGLPPRDTAA